MTDPLAIGLACTLGIVILLGVALDVRALFYQGSVQQRFDSLFTEE